jgi:hypothetical protein
LPIPPVASGLMFQNEEIGLVHRDGIVWLSGTLNGYSAFCYDTSLSREAVIMAGAVM